MEKAESGQFLVLSFLLQDSQTTVKEAMEETGFSKATFSSLFHRNSKHTTPPLSIFMLK